MESVHWSPGMALDALLVEVLERAREVA